MQFQKILILIFFITSSISAQNFTYEQLQMIKEMSSKYNGNINSKNEILDKNQTIKNDISIDNGDDEIKNDNKKYKISEKNIKNRIEKKDINPLNYEKSEEKLKNISKYNKLQSRVKIKKYGEQFFNNKNQINPYSIPTPSNYLLSNGDKLSISIYNGSTYEHTVKIDRDGKITIPKIGNLKLIGLNFEEAKKKIIQKCKQSFPNSRSIIVEISEYSSLQVNVSGFVTSPGFYNLNSFSTIKEALIMSGGITKNGSYRNILLKRHGKVIHSFDLYRLIRYGDSSQDTVLRNGDTLIVAPLQKEITLKNGDEEAVIYELKKGESYKLLFYLINGINPKASSEGIKLTRYNRNRNIKILTLNLEQLYNTNPKHGDEIEIFLLTPLSAESVIITGNVVNPGKRALPSDKKLSTLLKQEIKRFGKKGVFLDTTNYDFALVKNDNRVKPFNLKNILDNLEDITLKSGDKVFIFNKNQIKENPYIYANGIVVNPKKRKYQYYKGMKVKNLFNIVNFRSEIFIIRDNEDNKNNKNYDIDKLYKLGKIWTKDEYLTENNMTKEEELSKILKREKIYLDKNKIRLERLEDGRKKVFTIDARKNPNFELKAFDNITFFRYELTHNKREAIISGEVFLPGTYDITNDTTINDLIKLAGGITKKAMFDRVELIRYFIKNNYRQREVKQLNLKEILASNMKILPDDEIKIFPIANWNEKKYVTINGAIKFPGTYAIEQGEKLSSIIKRAGGFLDNAFIEGAVFTREDVRKKQEKRMKEVLQKLKIKSIQLSSASTTFGEDKGDKLQMVAAIKQLEEQANSIKPIGRVSIKLFFDEQKFQKSSYNLTLKENDKLFIPTIDDTVTVMGEILSPNTFVYLEDNGVMDYINDAGGLNETADKEHIYIVKANGVAKKYKKNYFFEDSGDIFKGDTIVVPLKLDTFSNMKMAKDVTSILYQLAITAASLHTVGAI